MKTLQRFDWSKGHTIAKILSKSFDTIEEAQRFAIGKQVSDIYKTKGKFKVEWVKEVKSSD